MRLVAAIAFALVIGTAHASPGPQSFTTVPAGQLVGNPNIYPDNPVMHGQAYANTGHLAVLNSANMNITTDQPMAMFLSNMPAKYQVTSIYATNCSASPSGAVGGIYTATSKGGTAVVAASQTYTSLASATAIQSLTNNVSTTAQSFTQLYFSLTTPSGSAETCDIYVDGIGLQ